MSDTPRRGPYAKGIARREQILHEALLAYSESDSSGPSLRSIAARVGLSERGLLHYFASRDELFISILERRDSSDRESSGENPSLEALAEVQAHSAETPGLVRLFLEMAAAAPDPAHYGHEFFTGRYGRLRELVSRRFRSIAGESKTPIPSEDDAAFVARVLIAASDGLQVQWLLDPSIDMRSDLVRLARVLRSEAAVGQEG